MHCGVTASIHGERHHRTSRVHRTIDSRADVAALPSVIGEGDLRPALPSAQDSIVIEKNSIRKLVGKLEKELKETKAGLTADTAAPPVPPWAYRKEGKKTISQTKEREIRWDITKPYTKP